jgi:hypothetical protein
MHQADNRESWLENLHPNHECNKILIIFVGKSKSIIFIALNRMGQLNNYTYWPSGGAVSVNGWNTGEPAHITNYNCGAFQLNAYNNFTFIVYLIGLSRNSKWMDTKCIEANTYICETPAPNEVCKS